MQGGCIPEMVCADMERKQIPSGRIQLFIYVTHYAMVKLLLLSGKVLNGNPWMNLDMSAYANYNPETTSKTSAIVKQQYINYAIGSLDAETPGG